MIGQLQVGYYISPLARRPATYHARVPETDRTLCGRSARVPARRLAKGATFGWTGGSVSVTNALWMLTNKHRRGCKTCIKLAPKYRDTITRLGRLV